MTAMNGKRFQILSGIHLTFYRQIIHRTVRPKIWGHKVFKGLGNQTLYTTLSQNSIRLQKTEPFSFCMKSRCSHKDLHNLHVWFYASPRSKYKYFPSLD